MQDQSLQVPFENSWSPPQPSPMDIARNQLRAALSQQQSQPGTQQAAQPPMDMARARQMLQEKLGNVPRGTPEQPEDRGFWNNLGRHATAIAGSAAQNTAKNFQGMIPGMSAIPQGYRPWDDKMNKALNTDIYQTLDVEKGLGDEIAQGALEYTPFGGAAKGLLKAGEKVLPAIVNKFPNFAANTLGGAMYGGQQSGEGAGWGALGGALSTPIAAAATMPFKYAAGKIAQSAIPGMVSKAGEAIGKYGKPEFYADKLKGIYSGEKAKSKELYSQLNDEVNLLDKSVKQGKKSWNLSPKEDMRLASELDNSRKLFNATGVTNKQLDSYIAGLKKGRPLPNDFLNAFSSNKYINTLKRERTAVNKKIGSEPLLKEKYGETLNNLNDWISKPPKTWREAMQRQEAMNYAPKSYELKNNASDEYLKGAVGKGSGALKKSINESLRNAPLSKMKELYPAANKEYQKVQDFYKAPNKAGEMVYNKTMMNTMKGKESGEAALFSEIMAKPSQTGVTGFKHLSKLYGNEGDAKNAMKSYFFRNMSNGKPSQDALSIYSKLNKNLRNDLFGKDKEGKLLKAAFNAEEKFGRPKHLSLKTPATYLSSGASDIARLLGAGNLPPAVVNALAGYSKNPSQNTGRYLNKIIAPMAAQYGENQ